MAFCKARETLITPARPATLSEWPMTVLIPPTRSGSELHCTTPSLGKKAVAIASASIGSPAGVPVPTYVVRKP